VIALGIGTAITSPASAQYRQPSHHERMSQLPDYAPAPSAQQLNSDIPYYGEAPYDERDDW
jgi:hypothetical protein